MLIGSIFFAAMSLLTETLRDDFSFAWIAAFRSLLATIGMVAYTLMTHKKLVYLRPGSLWMRSLAGCSAMLCLFYAMTHYDVAVVLSLSGTFPIWVAVLSWPLLGHFPSSDTWLALAISTVGMMLVYLAAQPSEGVPLSGHALSSIAIPIAATAAILSGVALIGLHKVKQVDPSAVVAHFSGVSTIVCFLVWMMWPSAIPLQDASISSWLRLSLVALTAMLGQFFLTKAFATGPPAKVAVVGLSQVAIAASYKWLVVHRVPNAWSLLGMAMVVVSTFWVLLRNARQAKA